MGPLPEGSAKTVESSRQDILLRLRERIVGFAASKLQRDAAEDLAQEVLILLHEKYGHIDRLEDLVPLALQIVRFKIMALRRKALRRGEYNQLPVDELPIAANGDDPLRAAEQRQMRERLIAAIGQMGERCRKLFLLKLDGKTFTEIQAILGAASINTIYTWDSRCRKQLLERMGGNWEQSQ
jgi:RNA polymerase sigma-70 factor (ECF subfamily)